MASIWTFQKSSFVSTLIGANGSSSSPGFASFSLTAVTGSAIVGSVFARLLSAEGDATVKLAPKRLDVLDLDSSASGRCFSSSLPPSSMTITFPKAGLAKTGTDTGGAESAKMLPEVIWASGTLEDDFEVDVALAIASETNLSVASLSNTSRGSGTKCGYLVAKNRRRKRGWSGCEPGQASASPFKRMARDLPRPRFPSSSCRLPRTLSSGPTMLALKLDLRASPAVAVSIGDAALAGAAGVCACCDLRRASKVGGCRGVASQLGLKSLDVLNGWNVLLEAELVAADLKNPLTISS